MPFVPEGDRSARVLRQPLAEAPDHFRLIALSAIQPNGQSDDETDHAIVFNKLAQVFEVLLGHAADLPSLQGNRDCLIGVTDGDTQPFGAKVQTEQCTGDRDRGRSR